MKKFLGFGFHFFVGDIISRVDVSLFGRVYWALDPNHKRNLESLSKAQNTQISA